MRKMIQKVCPCGKAFEVRACVVAQRCCSISCGGKYRLVNPPRPRMPDVDKICPCGNAFSVPYKQRHQKCCSHACACTPGIGKPIAKAREKQAETPWPANPFSVFVGRKSVVRCSSEAPLEPPQYLKRQYRTGVWGSILPGAKRQKANSQLVEEARRLYREGATQKAIAEQLGISHNTIQNWVSSG